MALFPSVVQEYKSFCGHRLVPENLTAYRLSLPVVALLVFILTSDAKWSIRESGNPLCGEMNHLPLYIERGAPPVYSKRYDTRYSVRAFASFSYSSISARTMSRLEFQNLVERMSIPNREASAAASSRPVEDSNSS